MDAKQLTDIHRRHEHEREQMSNRHVQAHMQLREKHHHERHQMHQRHEQEMMGQAGAEGDQAASPNAAAEPGMPTAGQAGPVPGAPAAAPGNEAAA